MQNKSRFFIFLVFLLFLTNFSTAWSKEQNLLMTTNFSIEGKTQPFNWSMKISFNAPVSTLEISKKLNLFENNKQSSFKFLKKENDKSLQASERKEFVIAPSNVSNKPASYTLKIGKNLKSADGKLKLSENEVISFETCPEVVVENFNPYFESTSNKGVYLYLNKDVEDTDLRKAVKVFPPIGYVNVREVYNRNANQYRVYGNFKTGTSYEIKINGAYLSRTKTALFPASYKFKASGPKPEIRFDADRSVIELKSKQLIPLSFINTRNFKCQLMRTPAIFAKDFEDLTVFADAEAERPNNSDARRINDEARKRVAKAAATLDNLLLNSVNKLKALSQLSNATLPEGFENFTRPDFSSDSEAYIGSENPDKEYFFSLPLDSRPQPEVGGPLIIRVNEIDVEEGQQASRLFQITDLSITYKFSGKDLLFWVTSIESGEPIKNAFLMLSDKNGVSLFPGKTDSNGLIILKDQQEFASLKWNNELPELSKNKLNISDLRVATVATEKDSSFVSLNSNRFFPSTVSQTEPGSSISLSSKGHVFTERGVYKQGEKVFWKSTIREYVNNEILPPVNQSARVTIHDSKDEKIYSEIHKISEFGTCSGELNLKDYSPLGRYQINVELEIPNKTATEDDSESKWDYLLNRSPKPAKKTSKKTKQAPDSSKTYKSVAQTGFEVQDFEPPRHYVELEMKQGIHTVKSIVGKTTEQKYLECKVKGLYYTGGPVRHGKVQWTAYLVGNSVNVKNYPQFKFGSNDSEKNLIESGNSVLNKDGELTLAFPISDSILSGMNSIEVSATVLDVDGRPSTGLQSYNPESEVKLGISELPGTLTQGEEFPIQVIALDKQGNKINRGDIKLNILRQKWFYTQKRDSDGGIYYSWTSGWMRTQTASQKIMDGVANFDLLLAEGGQYMVQAEYQKDGVNYKTAYSFDVGYYYESYNDLDGRRRTRSENEIILIADKATAATGDTVKFRFSLPKPAKYGLITKELGGIISARVQKLDSPQGYFTEKIDENCLPNVYVTFTAPGMRGGFPIYNSQMDSEYPRTYFAVSNIKVQNTLEKLQISIAPETTGDLKARPGENKSYTIKVNLSNNAPAECEMAVCVVDEAILSLTGFNTPILDKIVDFLLPLSVFSGDLRTSIISQELYRLISTRGLTGGGLGSGDLSADMDIRKDFRPVAYWNPSLLSDKNGKAEINFTLPDSTTAYRFYVVAINKKAAFASNQRKLVVSKEFYLEPALPRFLTSGDEARFKLSLCNKTNRKNTGKFQIVETSKVNLKPEETQLELEPFTNGIAHINMSAEDGAGLASMLFSGEFEEFKDAIKKEIQINPSHTILTRHLSGSFSQNTELKPDFPDDLKTAKANELEETLKARLTISSNSWSKITPSLNYLLRYPYGCVEQTSSGIIPLAALRTLIQNGKLPGFDIQEVDKFIEAGLSRLYRMQTYSGGFSYWMGGTYPSWWGTQYAVFALSLARKAGVEIEQSRLDKALTYIRNGFFKSKSDESYRHGISALGLVNLAINGKLTTQDLVAVGKKYKNDSIELQPMMLWAATLAIGNKNPKLLAEINKLKVPSKYVFKGWYESSDRATAISLAAVISGNGSKKLADELAGALMSSIKDKGRCNSTSDTGMALFALSAYFAKYDVDENKETNIELTIGDEVKQLSTGKNGLSIDVDPEKLLKAGSIKLTASNKTLLNYSLEYGFPDLASRSENIESGFYIEKTVENLNGDKEIKIGDLLKITLEIEDSIHKNGSYSRYHYLAIEDPIPAGFIAINPALKSEDTSKYGKTDDEESYCSWENGAYTLYPDHSEIHNDKVLIFKDRIWSGRFRYTYFARAICEGTFKMKPSLVSLMYQPDYFGMTTGKIITIKEK